MSISSRKRSQRNGHQLVTASILGSCSSSKHYLDSRIILCSTVDALCFHSYAFVSLELQQQDEIHGPKRHFLEIISTNLQMTTNGQKVDSFPWTLAHACFRILERCGEILELNSFYYHVPGLEVKVRVKEMKEGKVLRVFSSGRWLPCNQG